MVVEELRILSQELVVVVEEAVAEVHNFASTSEEDVQGLQHHPTGYKEEA